MEAVPRSYNRAMLPRLRPEVVFTDVRLPGMSGIDLLRRIREFDPAIPVIIMTAYGTIEGAVEAVKLGAFDYLRPMDLKFGPDGALYLIEWGSGFGGNNTDSGIYRIDYVVGSRAPIARASADRTSGPTPLAVQFSSAGSRAWAGAIIAKGLSEPRGRRAESPCSRVSSRA